MFYVRRDFGDGTVAVIDTIDGVIERVKVSDILETGVEVWGIEQNRIKAYKGMRDILNKFLLQQKLSGVERFDIVLTDNIEEYGLVLDDLTFVLEKYIYSGETRVVIPSFIECLFGAAFKDCDMLEEVILPQGLRTIDCYCFEGCLKLSKIILPSDLMQLSGGAFYKCFSLERISIPKNITSIPVECFADCVNLSEIILPEGLREINDYAFIGCMNLSRIVLPSGLLKIGAAAFTGTCIKDIVIPRSAVLDVTGGLTTCETIKRIGVYRNSPALKALAGSDKLHDKLIIVG